MRGSDTTPAGVFWRPNPDFLQELSSYLEGKRVLEIFAGNGFLARQLKDSGVDVTATSLRMGHDAHFNGLFCDVLEMEASNAVFDYGRKHDFLLVCWPTVTDRLLAALTLWGFNKPVVYIGETPRPELGMGGLSGCATDEFFEVIRWEHEFAHYKGNMLEKAGVIYLDKTKLRRLYEQK